MCPLANNLNTHAPHCYSWSLVQRGYSTFNVSSCQTTGLLYYAPHYYDLTFGPRVDIQHFMCPLANNWPPQYCTHYTADLWSKVDIQHFNVSSCQQLASSILTSLLCNWSFGPKGIFNILMCPLANNWPQCLCTPTMQLIFGPKSGYSTF
jgi:hypothetical protein